MMETPIKIQIVKSLSNLKPSRIIAVKADGDSDFLLYITDKTGVPFPLRDNTGVGGILSLSNTDGNLVITGVNNKVINISSTLLITINSALQSGDNISTLLNDVGYLTNFIEVDPIFQASEASLFLAGDKANLDNQSGINSGDETTLSIQTKRPLKTVEGNSLEGVGDINLNIPTNTSDLINDSDYVVDALYVHTDNNYTSAEKTKLANIEDNAEVNVVETLSSTGNTISIGLNISENINLEVVQATESQLGGAQITTQATIEDETTTEDIKTVTAKKFWQGWVKGLTLTSFFNAVRGTILTGLSASSGTFTSSDTFLVAFDKIKYLIDNIASLYVPQTRTLTIGGVTQDLSADRIFTGGASFQGNWNAETNTPTLSNGTGTLGHEYRVSVSGYQFGEIWLPNDIMTYDGSVWFKKQDNNQNFVKNFPLEYHNTNSGLGVQNLGEGDLNENSGTTNHAAAANSYPQFGVLASYENARLLRTQAIANATTNIKHNSWARLQTNQGFYLKYAIKNGDASTNSASRFIYGMFTGTVNLGNIDPSTTGSSVFGISADSADTNVQILARTGSVTIAKIDTGWSKDNLDGYYCQWYREKGSSKLFYIITNVTLDQTIKGVVTFNPNTAMSPFYIKGNVGNAIATGFHHFFTKLNTSV